MAEPISLASGLLALATFAFQSSITLYQTIQSFRSHPKNVRDLIEELEALNAVLSPLPDVISATTDVDLSAVDLPLLRCGTACKDFEKQIRECVSQSSDNRTSLRAWTKLRFMGDNIDGFRRQLDSYKLTINVALTDANLRKSSVTAESLGNYRNLIDTAKADLEDHLENMDSKLEVILENTVARSHSDADTAELQQIKEEKLSTERSLKLCAQLSDHIDQIWITRKGSGSSSGQSDLESVPERLTNEGLQECKTSLSLTASKLGKHMEDLMDQLLTKSKTAMTSEEDFAELKRLRDQWEATLQCMNICSKADNHLKENVSSIENYATGDAVQFMVSTKGHTIDGKNRGLGWRSRQVGGHLDDVSVQSLSRDFTTICVRDPGNEPLSLPAGTTVTPDDGAQGKTTSEYKARYGPGFKLSPETIRGMPSSSTGEANVV